MRKTIRNCIAGNGCKFCRPVNLYASIFYCQKRSKYLYLEDVKECKYYKELK